MAAQIPVIDCSKENWKREIVQALKNEGFVFLRNSGIPEDHVNEIFDYSKRFWLLEDSIKLKYSRNGEVSNNGYVSVGVECLQGHQIKDLKESFNISPYQTEPACYPDELPGLKKAVDNIMQSCYTVTEDILEILCKEFKDHDKVMIKGHEGCLNENDIASSTTLRMLHYPPINNDLLDGSPVMRCGEHADYGSLTFLFQDDVGGLEVQSRSGEYVPVIPVPGTVLLNTGSLMSHWTSNKIQAVKHRIRVPDSEELRQRHRYSFACFIQPDDDFLISPLDGNESYKPITSGDYIISKFATSY